MTDVQQEPNVSLLRTLGNHGWLSGAQTPKAAERRRSAQEGLAEHGAETIA